mgnify:CR=1 FL=1
MESITLGEALIRLKSSNAELFTTDVLQRVLGYVDRNSFHKALQRLEKAKIITRLVSGKYYFGNAQPADFVVANFLIQPSYISLETALNLYGILPQFPYPITSITLGKSKKISTLHREYEYIHVSPEIYWGFAKTDNCVISSPEKAVIDMFYLASKGLRVANVDEWDWSTVNTDKLDTYAKNIDNRLFNSYYRDYKPA